jgi:hypothetical protein
MSEIKGVAFISGPLTTGVFSDGKLNAIKYERNVREAEYVALKCNEYGWATICVHAESRYYMGTLPEAHWIAACFAKLALCSALVLVGGRRAVSSSGTRAEVRRALELSIPVYLSEEALRFGRVATAEDLAPFSID